MAPLLIYIILPVIGVWYLFGRTKKSVTPNIPYVKFDGDNSPARYQNETIDLLAKGYEQVRSFMHITTSSPPPQCIPLI